MCNYKTTTQHTMKVLSILTQILYGHAKVLIIRQLMCYQYAKAAIAIRNLKTTNIKIQISDKQPNKQGNGTTKHYILSALLMLQRFK